MNSKRLKKIIVTVTGDDGRNYNLHVDFIERKIEIRGANDSILTFICDKKDYQAAMAELITIQKMYDHGFSLLANADIENEFPGILTNKNGGD